MRRRRFLQSLAASAAGISCLPATLQPTKPNPVEEPNMRGPETAQFGLTLSLPARYYNYTHDATLLQKHKRKIEATAALLEELHEESLQLPKSDLGYGLIHGWSESDSCLSSKPATWWLPYFSNSAFTVRGLRDIACVWAELSGPKTAARAQHAAKEWFERSKTLEDVVSAMRKDIRYDMTPHYADLPGFPCQRASESATVAASPAYGTASSRHPPSGPGQSGNRLHAHVRRDDIRRRCQRRTRPSGLSRHSRIHFLRLRADASTPRPR